MNKKLLYGLIGIAVLFFIVTAVVFIFNGGGGDPDTAATPEGAGEEVMADTVDLKLFTMRPGNWRLQPLTIRVPRPGVRTDLYREFLRLLLQPREGMIMTFPEGTALRTLFYLENSKILVVDFTQELINRFPSGSRAEMEFIQFIVNNICYNFREIQSVRFMIAGNEVKTLSGHIDLSRPFRPNFAYLQDE